VLTPDTLAAIAWRLAEHAGLELPAWVVDARATARIAAVGCSPGEYVALIGSARGAGELAELIEAVRVGESRLFRHRSQIDVLVDVVAPALRARGRRAIRVWSAGCAAGEEPYTLAIVLSRALPDCAISIVATDVSAEALARAAAARYPRAALDHVPEHYRNSFVVERDMVRVAPEIAALVELQRANLTGGPAPRGCDLVWCRNVLIYFTAEARRRAIDRLVGATLPGGFVFVGYSESLRDVAELDGARASDTVYYVRRATEAPRSRPPTLQGLAVPPVPALAIDRRSAPLAAPGERTPPPAPATDRRSAPIPAPVTDRRSAPIAAPDERTPPPAPVTDRRSAPIAAPDERTPPPALVASREPATHDVLVLHGRPTAAHVIAEISARLALSGLQSLTIDLDGVELLEDDLAPVLRRARAAAEAAGVQLRIDAVRPGPRRWLIRQGLAEDRGDGTNASRPGAPARRP
jgi:chemotaxis protein methyltransferase CheR